MNRVKVPSTGPLNAKVMIIGEAPGKEEVNQMTPFVGSSGIEMTKMLMESGFIRAECRISNVVKYQPPSNKMAAWLKPGTKASLPKPNEIVEAGKAELLEEIDAVKPDLIIAFGNAPLWALTNNWGIGKWRGSVLWSQPINGNLYRVVPTYHPAAILRRYEWRFIACHDLRRAKKVLEGKIKKPVYNFHVNPSYDDTVDKLEALIKTASAYTIGNRKLHIAADIETRGNHIACIGFAWSKKDAICIPFIDNRKADHHYWSIQEEAHILFLMQNLLTHPQVNVSGQNWPFDARYIAKYWGFEVNLWRDTMSIHHVCFAGLPKGLDFQSSFYLDWHEYWKDEGKDWDAKVDEMQLWVYNCKDCVATYEIAEEQTHTLETLDFKRTTYGTPAEIQQSMHDPIFLAMIKGVKVDTKKKLELIMKIEDQICKRQIWINKVTKRELNCNSPKQLTGLFYDELNQKKIYNMKDGRRYLTADGDALELISQRTPGLAPLCAMINQIRQLRSALAFCTQPLDIDKRIRCAYTIPGTETYRLNSKKDAFGFGTNLQNVTAGEGNESDEFYIPNLRGLLVPDDGFTIGDFDLAAADAQVVAADAGDYELVEIFRSDYDLHTENARRWDLTRPIAKGCVHAVDYGATKYALSANFGIPQKQAQHIIDDWFSRRPLIKDWQDKISHQLMTQRYVENAFGYRRYYFDRIDNLLKEALAWIPQSTVAIVTNLGIRNVYQELLEEVRFLLQVHDSAIYQWKTEQTSILVPKIIQCMTIPIPYKEPLTIRVGANVSTKSWGDCK